jgi:hypothetical protein
MGAGASASAILVDELPKGLPDDELDRLKNLVQEKLTILQAEGKSEEEIRSFLKKLVINFTSTYYSNSNCYCQFHLSF